MLVLHNKRYICEYLIFVLVVITAVVLGTLSSPPHLESAHGANGHYSLFVIFGENLLIILGVLLANMFSGGLAGAIIIFLNIFLYGRFFQIYYRSSILVALFPWFEFISIVIAAQVVADIFWSLMFGQTIRVKVIFFSLSCCAVLLFIAAFIESDILHV